MTTYEDPNREAVGLEPIWRLDNDPPEATTPVVDSVTPATLAQSAPPTTLHVAGSSFSEVASLQFTDPDGITVPYPTTHVSETELTTDLATGQLMAGAWAIGVLNPGGGSSDTVAFTVTATAEDAGEDAAEDADKTTTTARKAKS